MKLILFRFLVRYQLVSQWIDDWDSDLTVMTATSSFAGTRRKLEILFIISLNFFNKPKPGSETGSLISESLQLRGFC